MLRASLLVALVLLPVSSACAGGSSRAPKWPKSHVAETDGGESLAPRQASSVAAIEKTSDDDEVKEDKPVAKAEKPAETPAAAAPSATATPTEDVITTEDIVIEIDE